MMSVHNDRHMFVRTILFTVMNLVYGVLIMYTLPMIFVPVILGTFIGVTLMTQQGPSKRAQRERPE